MLPKIREHQQRFGESAPVLIHCRSGKNRSPAVCLVALTEGSVENEKQYNVKLASVRSARRDADQEDIISAKKNGFEIEIRAAICSQFFHAPQEEVRRKRRTRQQI